MLFAIPSNTLCSTPLGLSAVFNMYGTIDAINTACLIFDAPCRVR